MKWIRVLLVIVPTTVILIFSLNVETPGSLKDADIHIIEAWIPPPSLEYAAEYLLKNDIDSVYLVGVGHECSFKKNTDSENLSFPVNIVSNGYVMMHPNDENIQGDSICIDIEGYSANNIGAFVLFFVNDQLIDQRIISGRDTINIHCKDALKNLIIYFANDTYCKKKEDRNLRIHSIAFDQDKFKLEKQLGGVHILPEELAMSDAKKVQLYLEELGHSNICFEWIERNTNKNNKTLQAALLFKKWMEKQAKPTKRLKVNIFTSKYHSERTYINYKNALKPYAEIGIITADETFYNCDSPHADNNFFAWVDESVSLIYTKLYWLLQ